MRIKATSRRILLTIVAFSAAWAAPAGAETLLTKSHAGSVSLNRNLNADECEKARIALLPRYTASGSGTYSYVIQPGDIEQAECLR